MFNAKDVDKVVKALISTECYSAVKYLSPTEVVRVTKPRYRHKRKQWDRRDSRLGLSLTIGRPNYRERKFIKQALAAGEPFPVRKIQLRDFPQAR